MTWILFIFPSMNIYPVLYLKHGWFLTVITCKNQLRFLEKFINRSGILSSFSFTEFLRQEPNDNGNHHHNHDLPMTLVLVPLYSEFTKTRLYVICATNFWGRQDIHLTEGKLEFIELKEFAQVHPIKCPQGQYFGLFLQALGLFLGRYYL